MNSADGDLPPYLTVQETAEHLRVNIKTVYAAIAAGTLRAISLGRTRRIPREALAELAEGSSTPAPGRKRGRRGS
jgi:excisionase family DNA binding protein